MNRRDFIVAGTLSFGTAISGCLGLTSDTRDKPWISVRATADNILVGIDNTQYLEIELGQANVMARRLPDENQEHHFRVDLSPLEEYGVSLGDLSIEKTQSRIPSRDANTNVETMEFTDEPVRKTSPDDVVES